LELSRHFSLTIIDKHSPSFQVLMLMRILGLKSLTTVALFTSFDISVDEVLGLGYRMHHLAIESSQQV
jgi:hypothetical protein